MKPSKRTYLKFGRDLLVALVAATCGYIVDNAASLNLGETGTAILVAVSLLGYRWARGAKGGEPA